MVRGGTGGGGSKVTSSIFNLPTFLNIVGWKLQQVSLLDTTWYVVNVEDKWKSS